MLFETLRDSCAQDCEPATQTAVSYFPAVQGGCNWRLPHGAAGGSTLFTTRCAAGGFIRRLWVRDNACLLVDAQLMFIFNKQAYQLTNEHSDAQDLISPSP